MQLTDDEIREILRREKRKKRKKQQARRRFISVTLLLIAIAIFAFVKFHPVSDPVPEEEPPRGIIFIDPGHGGSDPGVDNGARYEKDDTLKLGLAVRTYLEGEGFEVHMSRTDDTAVDKAQRAVMANECKAQLMISLHRNQVDGKGEGVEAFIPKLDAKESRLLADNLLSALASQGFAKRTVRAGTLNDPEQDYDEIGGANMPSCLLEVGFISSMEDNTLFDKNLDGNAKAIATAIESTFKTLFEPETESKDSEAASAETPEETPEDAAEDAGSEEASAKEAEKAKG